MERVKLSKFDVLDNKLSKALYEELVKILRDRVVYGSGFYKVDKKGNIKHVPYRKAINAKIK